jgi:hypothetical protein
MVINAAISGLAVYMKMAGVFQKTKAKQKNIIASSVTTWRNIKEEQGRGVKERKNV